MLQKAFGTHAFPKKDIPEPPFLLSTGGFVVVVSFTHSDQDQVMKNPPKIGSLRALQLAKLFFCDRRTADTDAGVWSQIPKSEVWFLGL